MEDETGETGLPEPGELDTDERVEEALGLLADDPPEGDEPKEPAAKPAAEKVETKEPGKEPAATNSPKHKVTVRGQEIEVDEQELKNGYSRNEDYKAKTAELAEQRRALEAQRADANTKALPLIQRAINLAAKADPILAGGPPKAELAASDPAGYVRAKAQYDARVQEFNALRQEEARILTEQSQRGLARESELLASKVPEWTNPETRERVRTEAVDTLKSLGFNDQEINAATDHRMIAGLVELAALRKYKADTEAAKTTLKDKKVTAALRALKPQSNTAQDKSSARVESLKTRAARSGSTEDAVNAVMAAIGD